MTLSQRTTILNSPPTDGDAGSGAAARAARKDAVLAARRDITRRAALDSGARQFATNGFEATKMAAVAADAGVSLKALYEVFASKADLFEAVIADRFEQHVTPVLAAPTPADAGPGEQVLTLITGVLAAMEADRSFFLLYVRGSEGVPEKLRAAGRDPYAAYVQQFHDRLAALIAAQPRLPHLAAEPAELAAALTASVIALARLAVTPPEPRPITDVAAAVRAIFGPVLLVDAAS
ncbi:MAG: TetR/AcrR family transcriptional regulator [Solirubrobacterales bacterium]|nr:TetR/AcrR family transcriptional regulator [Solirubrobacterales bacterium]